jgi:MFS family permease
MNLRLLRNKNLSLLIFGQFVSMLGSGMQSFAFSLFVLKLTGSSTQFASVLAVGMLPRLILGPICGVFADWFDRKKIIVYLDLISGLLIGGLYIISITSALSMFHIYAAVILLSIISSLFSPAIGTAIPTVVDKDDLVEANALNRLAMTLCFMLAPIVAGAIFNIYGISVVLLINAVSFILSAISEMFMDLKSPGKRIGGLSYRGFIEDFKAGIVFIINHRLIMKIILLSVVANAVVSPSFSVGLIYVANMVIKISEIQLGMLQTLLVAGSLIGSVIAGYVGKKISLAKILYLALTVMGLLLCFIAINSSSYYLSIFSSNLIPYMTLTLLSMLVASVGVVTNIGVSTMMQKEVPLDIMGRVSSVKETISMGTIPMGQIIFGIVFDRIDSYIPLMLSGIIVVVSALVFNYSINRDARKDMALKRNEPLLNIN